VRTRRQGVHPQDRRLVWACVHTGYEPLWFPLKIRWIPSTLRWIQPQTKWLPQAETRKLRNISHIQYTTKMLRSRPGEIQETHAAGPRISHIPTYMHKQLQQHVQSTPTCISSNIYSTAQLIMVSTSTAQLLASQDINRLFRLCVHPGPVSSHISQPLVASFDKTATAPQTEQYWQSCNSWCKIHAKAVTSIPFSKGIRSLCEYSRWRKWQRHFYLAFPTKLSYYFQYIRSCMCNLIMLVYLVYHNLYLILHIFAHIFHHM
jgi:hypothetical protein